MFPAEALPLVTVASHLVHFALAMPILLIATVGFALHGDIRISATILLVLSRPNRRPFQSSHPH